MSLAVAHQHPPTGKIALTQGAREAQLSQTELVVINIVERLDLDSKEPIVAERPTKSSRSILRSGQRPSRKGSAR